MNENEISTPKKEFNIPESTPENLNFMKDLSEEQVQAVKYIDGCSIISAGAGSGKTRVLTYKIAYLISSHVPPSSILALTFTNKAANEMKSRIVELLDNRSANELWMGTFHSIFLRILRENFEYLSDKYKLNKYFTIYDQNAKNTLLDPIIEKHIEEYKNAKKKDERKIIQEILFDISDDISKIKNECKSIDEYSNDLSRHSTKIKKIYDEYVNKCRNSNAMDFDDILLYTYNMLNDSEVIASKYKSLFKYILVDEYQDTNTIQFNIINLIHGKNCNICVVGDDAQCIYSFRGSKIENIQKFIKTYSPLQFKLSTNYRSTKTIVEAVNKLIQYNEGQLSKILNTNAPNNPQLKENKIKIIASKDERDEAKKVVDKINELYNIDNEINNWGSFAILYRTHKQSEVFETQLKNSKIPYKIIGKIKFLERDIIVHIISYLRLVINQNDNISLQKIVNYSFSDISLKMKKIFDDADKKQISYWNIIISNLDSIKKTIKDPEKIIKFIDLIKFLKEKVTTEEPIFLIEQILDHIKSISKNQNLLFEEEDSKLIDLLRQMARYLTEKYYNDCCDYKEKEKIKIIEQKEQNEQNEDKKIRCSDSDSDSESDFSIFKKKSEKNNENVINNSNKHKEDNNIDGEDKNDDSRVIEKYGLKEFLDDLILLNANEDLAENIKDIDTTPRNMMNEKSNNVKLMTIHSSKGLEFNTVFVVGVEKGYYPIFHPSIKDRKKHEEEERRMFYVAITRAKQNCFISYAFGRIMGTGKFMKREKSQFIDELENRCLDFSGVNDNKSDMISINSSSFKHNLFKNYAYNNYNYSGKKRNRNNKFG